MEQNELFYATFPEARRADEERRQEWEQLLAKYWQKLEYYGLPMHFGSPFFPENMGEERYYHEPGYAEDKPCTFSASFSGLSQSHSLDPHLSQASTSINYLDLPMNHNRHSTSAVELNVLNPPQDPSQSPADIPLPNSVMSLSSRFPAIHNSNSRSHLSKSTKSSHTFPFGPRRNLQGGSIRLSPLSANKHQAVKKPPLACFFCRGRKIACGAPLNSSVDKTCK